MFKVQGNGRISLCDCPLHLFIMGVSIIVEEKNKVYSLIFDFIEIGIIISIIMFRVEELI